MRRASRLGPHPFELIDRGGERGEQVGDELVHSRLGGGRVVSCDVGLAQHVPDRGFGLAQCALPARPDLRRARDRAAVEVERALDHCGVEIRREVVDDAHAQIVAPYRERHVAESTRQLLEVARLADDHGVVVGDAHHLQVARPVDRRSQLPGARQVERVVDLVDVAEVDVRPLRPGEPCLQGHDFRCRAGGVLVPGEREQVHDVLVVLVAHRDELGIIAQEIVPVRHAQAGLVGIDRVDVGPLGIRLDRHGNGIVDAEDLQVREVIHQRRAALDGVDSTKLGVQRCEPKLLDSRFVHEARMEVADHPLLGARCCARCRGLLGDRAQVRLDVIGELAE